MSGAPGFEFDPSWPKPLPTGWITGQLPCVYVDHRDHVLIVNRGNGGGRQRPKKYRPAWAACSPKSCIAWISASKAWFT